MIDGRPYKLEVGKVYEINNQLVHSVMNKGDRGAHQLYLRLRAAPAPGPGGRQRVTTLIATSVVRGSHQGESHGGVYLVDFERQSVTQVIDWNSADIDWQGRGWDRGLRGIAFDGERVFIAASNELFVYSPDFELLASYRNPYLRHCHEIAVYQRRLYLTSTGFDALLGFDLDENRFCFGLHVVAVGRRFQGGPFDPLRDERPRARQPAAPQQCVLRCLRPVPQRPENRRAGEVRRPHVAARGRIAQRNTQCASLRRRRVVQRHRGGPGARGVAGQGDQLCRAQHR